MKFQIALAALAITVQSSYVRYWYKPQQAPAPAPTPAPVAPKCTLANEEVGPSGACRCKTGFVRQANLCVVPAAVVCGAFEAVNKDGKCDCQSGFSRNERGLCVTKLNCGLFEHVDPNNPSTCKCDLSYERQSAVVGAPCVLVCNEDEVRNATTKACDCKAPLKRDQYGNCVLNPVAPTVCQNNAHFDAHEGCVCDDGFIAKGTACVVPLKCTGANEELGKDECVCINGFYRDNGVCVNTVLCGDNEFKNHYGQCICVQGAYRVNGFCKKPVVKQHVKADPTDPAE